MFIKKGCLEFILGVSKNFYPKEFAGLLSGDKSIIKEVLLIPGSDFGDTFSAINTWMAPIGISAVGSIHSHPGISFKPSNADLNFFSRYPVNLIARYPYSGIADVAAYDRNGKIIDLIVSD